MASLLDFLSSDDAQLGIGLLAASAPQTDPSKTGIGYALQTAMAQVEAGRDAQAKRAYMQGQVEAQKRAAEAAALKQSMQQRYFEMLARRQQGLSPAPYDTPGAPSESNGAGPAGPAAGGGGGAYGGAGGGRLGGMTPDDVFEFNSIAKAADMPGIDTELYKLSRPKWQAQSGVYFDENSPNPQMRFLPQVNMDKGTAFINGQMQEIPGARAIARRGKVEDAIFAPGAGRIGASGRPEGSTQYQDLMDAYGGAIPGIPGSERNPAMYGAIAKTESNFNPNAVSSKGASGLMGTMPDTKANPGFGIRPSNGTPEDDNRVGAEYWDKMQQRYKNPALAAVAYNWGPGNADAWLAQGGDFSKLPKETQDYVSRVLVRHGVNQMKMGAQGGAAPQQAAPAAAPAAPVNDGTGVGIAGGKDYSPAEKTAQKVQETLLTNMAANDAKRLEGWTSGADVGRSTLGSIKRMRDIEKSGVFSGAGANAQKEIASWISQLTGVTPKNLPGSQAFTAEVSGLVTERLKNAFGGSGITEGERNFLLQTLPQLTQSPQAREALLYFMEEKAQKAINLSQAADEYVGKNKSLRGFDPSGVQAGYATLPPPSLYKGATMVDDSTGEVKQSDGLTWKTIKKAK